MTNFEKYKDEIKNAFRENGACGIRKLIDHGNSCLLMSCYECNGGIMEWLESEYKEPEVDWSKIEVDTPILVSNDGVSWMNRYFAKYEDRKVFYFFGGTTSWSNRLGAVPCEYAKLVVEGGEQWPN